MVGRCSILTAKDIFVVGNLQSRLRRQRCQRRPVMATCLFILLCSSYYAAAASGWFFSNDASVSTTTTTMAMTKAAIESILLTAMHRHPLYPKTASTEEPDSKAASDFDTRRTSAATWGTVPARSRSPPPFLPASYSARFSLAVSYVRRSVGDDGRDRFTARDWIRNTTQSIVDDMAVNGRKRRTTTNATKSEDEGGGTEGEEGGTTRRVMETMPSCCYVKVLERYAYGDQIADVASCTPSEIHGNDTNKTVTSDIGISVADCFSYEASFILIPPSSDDRHASLRQPIRRPFAADVLNEVRHAISAGFYSGGNVYDVIYLGTSPIFFHSSNFSDDEYNNNEDDKGDLPSSTASSTMDDDEQQSEFGVEDILGISLVGSVFIYFVTAAVISRRQKSSSREKDGE